MKKPICVLIPCYGNQEGLNRTCESLAAAEGAFDVLIVDDGSPIPLTIPACLAGSERAALHRTAVNRGITGALNEGLALAFRKDYRYIARLDSGDVVVRSRLRQQSELLDARPAVCVVGSYIEFRDMAGHPLFCFKAPTTHREIVRQMHVENCLVHSGTMLRTSIVRRVSGYRPECTSSEDYDLFLRMMMHGEAAIIPEALTICEHNLKGLSVVRRHRQQAERLHLQLRYFDRRDPASYYGVARTCMAILVPHRAVTWAKMLLLPRSGGVGNLVVRV